VYDYERWAVDWEAYLALFKATISGSSVVRGWTITCQSMAQERPAMGLTSPSRLRAYDYRIRGYFGLKDGDATEKTAFGLAVAVVDALDADATLHESYYDASVASIARFEPRIFGSVLCHYAEIALAVVEEQP